MINSRFRFFTCEPNGASSEPLSKDFSSEGTVNAVLLNENIGSFGLWSRKKENV